MPKGDKFQPGDLVFAKVNIFFIFNLISLPNRLNCTENFNTWYITYVRTYVMRISQNRQLSISHVRRIRNK